VDLYEQHEHAQQVMAMGHPGMAARELEPLVEAEPWNSEVRLELALACFGSAQLARAEEHLRVLVDREPTHHYAQHVLGRTLERLGRPEEALAHLRLAQAMAPSTDYEQAVARVARRTG
jgi:Flp pilus assembly protein TadD